MSERATPYPDVDEVTGTEVAPPWMTILHNCDCHTFEQVVKQLQKAIACSEEEGWKIAWQVHHTGRSVVKVGPEAECVRVGNILASIGLVVPVVQSAARPPSPAPVHHRADDPGRELFVADAAPLALGLLAGGHCHDLVEDLAADDGQRRALQDDAAVDVHVL